MFRDRVLAGTLAAGILAAAVALVYGVATELVRVPTSPGIPYGDVLVGVVLVVVPFAVGAGAGYLVFRHRVVLPLGAVAVFAAIPGLFGWHADQVLVGVLVAGPLVVVVALGEVLVRARLGRLANPPSTAGYRAISIGVMAALLYVGVFAIRAALPLWRIDTGAPPTLPPAVSLAVMLWYVLGVSLVLVGVPVASNRRFGLLGPLVGLVGYLLVDLAFVQPAVAEGTELVVVLLLAVWPTLAALFAGVGVVEWWIRNRRGEYEGGDDEGDGERRELTVEGGLFGDRI